MHRMFLVALFLTAVPAFGLPAVAGETRVVAAFTVSMARPSTHYLHVEMGWQGAEGDALDLKMPAWTPGYYKIMGYEILKGWLKDGEQNRP